MIYRAHDSQDDRQTLYLQGDLVMKTKDELLKELSRIIVGYLNKGLIWSHFSDQNGTTRYSIACIFIESNCNINSEDIRERVVNDVDRELTDEELQLFGQIQDAWREWKYIKEFG
jgi:hypothetical protein